MYFYNDASALRNTGAQSGQIKKVGKKKIYYGTNLQSMLYLYLEEAFTRNGTTSNFSAD